MRMKRHHCVQLSLPCKKYHTFQMLTYILSPLLHFYHLLVFSFCHLAIVMAYSIFGHKGRLKVIAVYYTLMQWGLYIVGVSIKVKGRENINVSGRPLIVASNHQSLYDIPAIGHLFSSQNIEFVAKSSLGKNIPTVSFNLRKGFSALIDRDKGGQSVRAIFALGKYMEENKIAVGVFPEGTRSRSGEVQEFMPAGIGTLLRSSPSALVQPFAIKGHSQLIAKSSTFLKVGQRIEYFILPAIDPSSMKADELAALVQSEIEKAMGS